MNKNIFVAFFKDFRKINKDIKRYIYDNKITEEILLNNYCQFIDNSIVKLSKIKFYIISYSNKDMIEVIEFLNKNIIIHNELLNLLCKKINKNFCNEIYELNKKLNYIINEINNLLTSEKLNFKIKNFISEKRRKLREKDVNKEVTWNEILFFIIIFSIILYLFSLYTNNVNNNFGIDFLTNSMGVSEISSSLLNSKNELLENPNIYNTSVNFLSVTIVSFNVILKFIFIYILSILVTDKLKIIYKRKKKLPKF